MQHSFEAVGHTAEILCIDPCPTEFLKSAAGQQKITLIEKPCQAVELSVYEGLGDGDLLFIDSTHTVKPGSEVNLLILEVLQRLHGLPCAFPRHLFPVRLLIVYFKQHLFLERDSFASGILDR